MGRSRRNFAACAVIVLALACVTLAQNARKGSSTGDSSPKVHELRMDVDIVLVPVTVTDDQNRYVTKLRKEHFQIWEDKVEQKIDSLSTEGAPMSLGIVLDISSSMKGTIRDATRYANGCLKVSDLSDEFFLVLFSSEAQPATEFTTDIRKLQNMTLFLQAKGSTALYDAVYKGLVKIKEAGNSRKALIVTDGGENNSHHGAEELKALIKEQDVQIYSIGNENDGVIRELSQLTGGRALGDVNLGNLGNICSSMVNEMKNQYILGYKSTNRAKDGRWRDIRVRMTRPPGVSNLHARSKRGYYAPHETDTPQPLGKNNP